MGQDRRQTRVYVRLTRLALVALALTVFGTPAFSRGKSLKEIREAGLIMQQWDTSCAAAALATVFTYHLDAPMTERVVAEGMLKTTDPLKVRHRGGFSLLDMKRFAATKGYEARAMRGFAFDDLAYFNGVIVPINQFGYNHYVVFRGIDGKNQVRLADPAFGNRTLSRQRFEGMWMDGIVFFVTDGQ